MVGTANDENAVSRAGSKRSIAFSSPSDATWIEVVERLAGALVAAGELARERQEALDQRLARGRVALVVIALEQAAILAARAISAFRDETGICSGLALALLGSILDGVTPSSCRHVGIGAPGLWGARRRRQGSGPGRSRFYRATGAS